MLEIIINENKMKCSKIQNSAPMKCQSDLITHEIQYNEMMTTEIECSKSSNEMDTVQIQDETTDFDYSLMGEDNEMIVTEEMICEMKKMIPVVAEKLSKDES
ncbi:unnamed protein product, partial [Owenia fusiformis]